VSPTGAVVQIVDADDPIAALRAFLDTTAGPLTVLAGQIALGSAQLLLLSLARFARDPHDRGPRATSSDIAVAELLDLVLARWGRFPDRTGFQAQEFLKNALAVEGLDRERLARLVALIPHDASAELRFGLACAYAALGDRTNMLRAVRRAIAAGIAPDDFLRDGDFVDYADDDELTQLLERAPPPAVAVDIRPHVAIVRAAIDNTIATLQAYGETVKLEPPATLDTILATERARRIQLPNDYRALLTICDGMTLLDREFLGTHDFGTDTTLARRARDYLEARARFDAIGIDDCVPLASWGQPSDWLLYDPFGRHRDGEPGILLLSDTDSVALDGIAAALEQFDDFARDLLCTN